MRAERQHSLHSCILPEVLNLRQHLTHMSQKPLNMRVALSMWTTGKDPTWKQGPVHSNHSGIPGHLHPFPSALHLRAMLREMLPLPLLSQPSSYSFLQLSQLSNTSCGSWPHTEFGDPAGMLATRKCTMAISQSVTGSSVQLAIRHHYG